MDSSRKEGGLASSQVTAVSVAPVSASNHGAGGQVEVDGNVTPESDVVVTRKRERSDDESEDVKKLQKEAEVKEEMRVKLRKLRGMDSSQEEGGLASSQVAAVSVAPVSASNPGADYNRKIDTVLIQLIQCSIQYTVFF